MWTRQASRLAGDDARFGAVIQVSATLSIRHRRAAAPLVCRSLPYGTLGRKAARGSARPAAPGTLRPTQAGRHDRLHPRDRLIQINRHRIAGDELADVA